MKCVKEEITMASTAKINHRSCDLATSQKCLQIINTSMKMAMTTLKKAVTMAVTREKCHSDNSKKRRGVR